jgi:hypothetical protein
MADLGALNLILGADLSPLEASLGRADELINRSAAQMQKSFGKAFKFKVEVGDLAVQLTQAEGVVDRSIRQVRTLVRQPIKFNLETGELNVQLTEAEALISRSIQDIKAMDRSIAFNLSVRGLDDVEGLVARSIQQMSALSNSVLTVQVDDKRLTELNQHLDAKQAHYARVQQQFATPLKVLVDDSQLTTLNQHLTATEQHLSSVAGKFAATKLTPAIDLTNLNLLDRRLNNSIDNLHRAQSEFSHPIVTNVDTRQLLQLEDLLDRVSPHKLRLDLPDTIGGLTSAIGKLALSPVTIPLKIAQNSLEGIFRGMSEGLGRELSRNFSKGFSSSIEGFVQKRTGMSTKEMGEQSGKYVATRGKIGAEYISQELGYKDGLRGVGNDLKAAGSSVDTVLRNPRRAVRKIENKLVEALEYYQEGETDKAMNVVTESFAPMGKLARRAAGVGIRAAAQPIRIRNRAMLKGKEAEAQELAKNIEIEGYDREAADKAEAIHIVTGGLDFNNGENAHFAGGLLKQQYPKAHTITHVNKAMNQPVKRGEGVVGGMMGMMEQLQKMGGKEGKIGDMPIQKLAEMAIDLGYNPDGLEMYAKAVKIRQAHPDKPINFIGTSGGVDAVQYATALSERAGMKNVKGVGLGLPMANLTELASKQNFQSIVGTLDDLDIAYHNEDHLGAKRLADPESMAKIRKTKEEKFPLDMSGIVSVGKTQKHIVDAGAGHAIGNTYLANDKVMAAVHDFIARPDSPTPEVRADIKDAASLNNFYADKFNAKRKEIPLTIAALYKDPRALARIEADPNGKTGDYTYFSPANKNHDDDWLRINEFDGLIKDVRGEDIQSRSAEENAKSKKKGLNKFIEDRRKKAAKKGTTSVVAEHAAGWLDYLDTMKSGMEEYGKTGEMPYEALQKGAEYYPELRPLAAREQHKRSVTGTQRKSVDRIYQSGNLSEINRLRESHKLPAISSNYGYQDALATPDWYLKDIDKQRADTAAEIARNQAEMERLKNNPAAPSVPITPTVDPVESERYKQDLAQRRANIAKEKQREQARRNRTQPLNLTPKIDPPPSPEVEYAQQVHHHYYGQANIAEQTEQIQPEPDPLKTLAADTARGAGKLAVKGVGATAKWMQNPVSQAIQSTAYEVGKSYRVLERAEDLAFQVIPFAGATKKAVTNVAAPMGIAYAAAQNPALGGAVNGLMGMAGGSIGSIGHALVDGATSLMPWGAKDLLGGVGNGVVDLVSTYAPALYGGKFALNAGKQIAKKAFPGFSRNPEIEEAEKRKQLDRSEVEEMKAAIQAELQALKNFQTLTQPDAPKITPEQDRAAQKTIADHTKEQESKLNQKFDRLSNGPANPQQPIATNIKSIDVGDAKAIESEVNRVKSVIANNRKKIQAKLKSKDPQEVAEGLSEAAAFGYGLNILKADLQSAYGKIAPTKISEPQNVKSLETSRTTIGGLIGSIEGGSQTKIINERIADVAKDSSLVDKVDRIVPAKGQNNIFDKIKASFLRLPKGGGNNDAGFINLGGRIPALDFLDTPVSQIIPNIKAASAKLFAGFGNNTQTSQFTPNPNAPSAPTLRNSLLYAPTFTPNPIAPPPPKPPNNLLFTPPPAEVEKSESALTKLTNIGKMALGVFGGFTLASLAVPAMIALGKSTIDTAANFETLQVKLAAASDSAQTGKLTFSRLTGEADKLGISRSSALETGAFIGGTTFGTELEGKPTDRMTSQILQIAQARGLSKQQTDGLNLALAQTLGRSRTSMQEINQLTQSAGITDARVIAAKGLGYTPQQFSAIQESPTGIDSKRFVQAFLAQGVQDSLSAKDLAQSSIGFKQTKLSAGIERLQGDVGSGISPAFKAGLDLLTGSIELLSLGIEKASNLLTGIGIRLLYVGGTALLPIILNSKLAGIAVNGLVATFSLLKTQGISIATEFALMAVAGEVISQVSKIWHNSSQEIEDAATKIGKAVDVINGKKVNPIGKPKTTDEIQGKDWGESAVLFGQRAFKGAAKKQSEIGDSIVDAPFSVGLRNMLGIKGDRNTYRAPLPVDSKEKEQSDRTIAIDNVLGRSSQAISAVDAAVQKAQKLQAIDLEINRLDSQRSGLYTNGEPAADKLASLNSQFNAKYQERDGATEGLTDTRNAIQEAINGIKGSKADLTAKFNEGQTLDDKGNIVGGNGQVTIDNYNRGMEVLDAKLQDAEQAQRKLNDAIKSGFDNLLPWTTSLDKIVASFDDIKTAAEESATKLSIGRNNLERGGNLTKGEAEYQGSIDKQSNIQTQIKQTAATIKELRAALLTKDEKAIENVQKNYGVDDSTSGTQLRLKADKATSVVDKEILSKLAIIKDKEINLTGLQSQFSDARTEMYRRIEQENRDAMLYYVGLAKQIDPQGTAFTKAIAQVTQEKNKLLSKLNGYGNGMFDSFIGSVLELFDSSKRKLDAMAQYATAKKSALDDYRDRSNQADTINRNAFNALGQQSAAPSNYPSGQSESLAAVESNSSVPAAQPVGQTRTVRPTSLSQQAKAHQNVKPQIDAAVRQLTPQQRHNYLNTTMSVDGKTDLGLDDFDRRVLGMGGGIPGVKVKKIGISPYSPKNSSSDRAVVNAINNGTYTPTTQSTIPQSTATPVGAAKLGKVKPINLGNWNGKSDVASQQILKQMIDKAETGLATAFSDDAYQSLIIQQKARRETKVAEQQNRSTIRKQQQSLRGLKPTRTIQEKQAYELEDFESNAIDTKESASNYRTNLGDAVGDIREIIPMLQARQGAKGLSAQERTLPVAQQKSLIEERRKKLIEAQKLEKSLSSTLKTVDTNFAQIDGKVKEARSRIVEQQGYDRDVAVEQTGIKERETKRSGIEAQRTGVQQTLRSQPFNSSLNASDRQLEEDAAIIAIQNEEIQALRALTEQERGGSLAINRSPAQVKAYVATQQAKIKSTSERKRKDVSENRVQKGKDFDFNVDTENRTFDAGKLQQEATGFDIGSRRQTALDRTDAPFANNNSIDRVYTRKIKELDLEQATADRTLIEKQKKYKGNKALLGRASQEFTEAKRQIELKRSTATVENNADTADRERSRRGVLYGNQVANFDSNFAIVNAQTQQKKLMGQDTREEDYQSQKLTKQKEFSQKEFDLNQQRSQITGMSTEAIAARAHIDGLLTNLQALEKIELSNLSAQFNQLNQVVGETQKATSDTFKELLKDTSTSLFDDFFGGKTQKEKALSDKNLKKYALNILSSPFLAFGNQMVDKLVPDLFSGLYQKSPQGAGSQPQGGGLFSSGLLNGLLGGLFGGGNAAPKPNTIDMGLSPIINSTPPQAEQTNNLLGSNLKLETAIPVLTSSIDNLTAAITNIPLASGLPSVIASETDDPFSTPTSANSSTPNSSISNSLLGGLTGLLGKGQSSSTNMLLSLGGSLLGGLLPFANGGIKGGIAPINNGIIGTGRSQVDNRLTLVEDGEAIVSHRGIDALGGPSVIAKINRGDIPRFASGGIKGANYSTPRPNINVPNLTSNATSLNNVNANVTINNSDGKSSVTSQEDGSKLGKLVNNAISAALIKEMRPGGMLYA